MCSYDPRPFPLVIPSSINPMGGPHGLGRVEEGERGAEGRYIFTQRALFPKRFCRRSRRPPVCRLSAFCGAERREGKAKKTLHLPLSLSPSESSLHSHCLNSPRPQGGPRPVRPALTRLRRPYRRRSTEGDRKREGEGTRQCRPVFTWYSSAKFWIMATFRILSSLIQSSAYSSAIA